jgi:hypothetical protein
VIDSALSPLRGGRPSQNSPALFPEKKIAKISHRHTQTYTEDEKNIQPQTHTNIQVQKSQPDKGLYLSV